METERFKDIKGYEGLYKVSNLGNIKSLNYNRTGEERILKPNKNKWGYFYVNLYKNKKRKSYQIHRLVALTFLLNPNNLPCVNHKNECKTDNRVSNLELCTYSYNNTYGTKTKRIIETKNKKKSVNAEKPVVQYTKNMIEVCRFKSINEAERQTGIPQTTICKCCKGKRKSAGNFVWRYI